ncbi:MULTISPECIES: DNA/RNA helicase domain-containing protein [Acidobacteriaceae]|uniref:DNA/RNA helicase domain-containing protein n=1 Tax=Acidobacteriaceae TaxID=204434 RepID=UPI00131DAE5B|nr:MULTISPECIES: DNA/RNA helicase domain-containing protein [Acidobacteriaceae]MDW5265697.1 DNA/RNA helicase domain-containing protein [Edaphobacter sp.]
MASFYRTTVGVFLTQTKEHVLAHLATAYANRGYTTQYSDQTLTWERDLYSLKEALEQCIAISDSAQRWGLILEFSIPRKELRIDVVLLIGDAIVLLEAKTGHTASQVKRQIEEYALLLHYFHKGSNGHRIIPILVSSEDGRPDCVGIHQREFFSQLSSYWVASVLRSSWRELPNVLFDVERHVQGQISAEEWDVSPYFPVPSIIEAATELRRGLSIREIAHCEASEHEIESVCRTVQDYVNRARNESHHAICFLTGVPGSGKTLVGLSLAHSTENNANAIHFMSGNGPLVKVLQHLFTKESMKGGASAPQARTEAKTLIENVHVFARYHTEDNLESPSNHAIIFDEAQRAWDRAQNMKKFHRDYSEPEMLLRIMERHLDWAIVVALVGGGQEINDGEAGLEEWGRALAASGKDWVVYASPEVLDGGASTAGHRLFEDSSLQKSIHTNAALHLRTSNRSLRAEQLAIWVNRVLDGDARGASALKITERFPILLTRNLSVVRRKLHEQGVGVNRYGLIGSSGAARLRAEGLEPSSSFHAEYPWEHWYLADKMDVRSSCSCEVFATEFEIQGLELDWIGLCWGGDFIWNHSSGWQMRALRHGSPTKWSAIKNREKRIYRQNAYRVLLTRARQGMVIFVPGGNTEDPTNLPEEFEATSQYLIACGVTPLV